ncbi:hypothetical protein VXM60_14075 [Shewanella khirikhana]|uniref:hypothetical protein n=1 Tax=Shewanella khirikhana TaxID=1965282 RepID=UPI0030CEC7FE
MIIECPHCKHDNEIEYAENICCKKCEKNYKGYKFSKRKLIATGTLVFGAAFGLSIVPDADPKRTPNRYPLDVEFALIDSCVNGSRGMVTDYRYNNKRDTCMCALNQTQYKVTYPVYKAEQTTFLETFKLHLQFCN